MTRYGSGSRASWQTIDRGLQLGALTFGYKVETLAINGWPDEHDVACHRAGLQRLRKGEARRCQIGRERRAQVWECVVGETEIWNMDGWTRRSRRDQDAARLVWKLDETAATILITSINVQTVGTRLRISPCWMWKARTRSGPCGAHNAREQTLVRRSRSWIKVCGSWTRCGTRASLPRSVRADVWRTCATRHCPRGEEGRVGTTHQHLTHKSAHCTHILRCLQSISCDLV